MLRPAWTRRGGRQSRRICSVAMATHSSSFAASLWTPRAFASIAKIGGEQRPVSCTRKLPQHKHRSREIQKTETAAWTEKEMAGLTPPTLAAVAVAIAAAVAIVAAIVAIVAIVATSVAAEIAVAISAATII